MIAGTLVVFGRTGDEPGRSSRRGTIIAVGGISNCDDVMEFLVAGASAVQLGTVNFFDPTASMRVVQELPAALRHLGAKSVREVVGTLE